ncbi:16S rRNA (guanine(527)-N(7))-methyltransferase RsmG [Moraxella sp. K127]|uniref:16S rRNA (guanine(527)-N(7))-methyltransferase RsmG n=1 Tax=Moraxella TaxID=475 RepID=UPI00188187FF|nr:16S rRNA (guanine(527)-N(7))-methyltransferase RsmG [Moraxella sp. K127]MBE9591213.1 16S rRNA (guanine(527)-N(7))-methyltransferase RsmG [Moraxella sp. K127]
MTYHKISTHADEFARELERVSDKLNLTFGEVQIKQLLGYLDNLLLWTKAYNLTAITAPKEAFIKHILDCLAIVADLPFADKSGISVLDIGTGAGLPSVIIAIMRPDWHVTALDSNGKKVRFIRQMVGELGLANVNPVASRIEDFDGAFDVITSRAFASLDDFVNLAKPYLKADGVLYAMKGKMPTSDDMVNLTDWQIDIKPIFVPQMSDERCVVYLKRWQ